MSPDLDKKLVERYPDLFQNRYKSALQTAMCWGFDCGDGWYQLIDTLCERIESRVQVYKAEPVIVDQVKEKFGTLSFYYSGGDDRIAGMVVMAEQYSAYVCETCGNKGQIRNKNHWLYTACDEHVRV